ncbi:MAG: bifunctional ornithine acetyltransferase/N-acetylglutamate synthase [Clostridia bacterium]|nr:bifunctional ornithine acetyltransferase/N-acetylglutamate synthase [Clostridia bacterium]
MVEFIEGGVCAPKGFKANGVHCGIRKNRTKRDLALIVSEKRCSAAAVYTTNLVKGAPILVTKEHLQDGYAQAIVVNSGNANTCNRNGVSIANRMCALVKRYTKIPKEDVIVGSTGVIGQKLVIDPIKEGMPSLAAGLGDNSSLAAEAIMTTDTVKKEFAIKFTLNGKEVKMGAIGKGVGMICPNMATLLLFITTDAAISPQMLQKALSEEVDDSLNMLSVDRDTSTNDTLAVLANGLAGNKEIVDEGKDFQTFKEMLHVVTTKFCKMLAADGEGATKLIECHVKRAKTKADARIAAKAVVNSNLVKAMVFGADANGGRVMCALGYSGADIDITKINVSFCSSAGIVEAYRKGFARPFDEELAKRILSQKEIHIMIDLNDGIESATAYGCDLTYDYVKINGDYRT